jgi:predicted hotdog family 3-hydroxylacyl-ACP dehydratase
MKLERDWIESRIPHQGRMCVLDEIVHWNSERISCLSGAHRLLDHPLRAHGRLGIACGIEFAAQAMALHGALIADAAARKPLVGLLASVRGVRMHVSRLDDVQTDLICDAVRIAGDRGTALYEFELRSPTMQLMSGRATVVLDAGHRLQP